MDESNMSLQKITCNSCGANLIYNPGTLTTLCNFCGSTFEIAETESNIDIVVPDGILPFSVTKEDFKSSLLEFLSEGDYTPDDILTSTIFDKYNGVYLPMYLYTGDYSGNWSASSGYDRQESYVGKGLDGKLTRKYRTVTDWRPANGQVAGQYSILGFGGKDIKPEVAVFAQDGGFGKGDLKDFDIKYTLDFTLLEYSHSEEDVWDLIGKGQLDSLGGNDVEGRIPGDRYKDLTFDLGNKHDSVKTAYIPTWLAYYKYKDEEYHVSVDGRNASRRDGVRPEDEDRKKQASKMFYPGHIGCFGTIFLWGYVFTQVSSRYQDDWYGGMWGALIATLVLYGIGWLRKRSLLNKSKLKREEILNKLKSGQSIEPEAIADTVENNSTDDDE